MRQTLNATLLALGLSALLAVPAVAQGKPKESAPHGAAADKALDKALVGTWDGTYTTDHSPTAAMQVVIARDSTLKLSTLSMAMGGSTQTVPTRNFVASDSEISWTQDTMGMSCDATAVLREGQLKGAIICGHASATFTLTRQGK